MIVTAAIAIAGCGGHGGGGEPDAPFVFIAFPSTFQPFRTWTSFHSDGPPDDGTFPVDVLGPRTQYINMLPPHGSTEFPIGTVIVEARESNGNKIFAGVKRGFGFNDTGARNWEWFELQEAAGTVTIVWRGVGPPDGEHYGGDSNGSCNTCHTSCGATNDDVCSAKLQLSSF
jgi:hypothetical protein